MKIQGIMSDKIVKVDIDDRLAKVKNLFESHQFHHLLVIEKNLLCGIISDRDLLKAVSPKIGTAAETEKDTATLNKRAHQIMVHKPITLTKDATIFDAIHLFNTEKISCIPVVDQNNHPIGMLSWRDILRTMEILRQKKLDQNEAPEN